MRFRLIGTILSLGWDYDLSRSLSTRHWFFIFPIVPCRFVGCFRSVVEVYFTSWNLHWGCSSFSCRGTYVLYNDWVGWREDHIDSLSLSSTEGGGKHTETDISIKYLSKAVWQGGMPSNSVTHGRGWVPQKHLMEAVYAFLLHLVLRKFGTRQWESVLAISLHLLLVNIWRQESNFSDELRWISLCFSPLFCHVSSLLSHPLCFFLNFMSG